MKAKLSGLIIAVIVAVFATLNSGFGEEKEIKNTKESTQVATSNKGETSSKTTASASEKTSTATTSSAGSTDNTQLELPAPIGGKHEQIIKHTGFTLSYNNKHNTPNWSAWVLTAKHTDGTVERCTKFWEDEQIATPYRVVYYDYKGSGYDRGHMCPAGDMKWNEKAMHDCFYMSNMCPQDPSLNSGSWKRLEEACRNFAVKEGRIYIVCGPIYRGKKHETIGIDHSIDVPEAFFKAILSMRKGHEKAIAFVYENIADKQSMKKTAKTVDEVEKITGLDLFHNLDDELETRLESKASLDEWEK